VREKQGDDDIYGDDHDQEEQSLGRGRRVKKERQFA
jgi:hypothetical protein